MKFDYSASLLADIITDSLVIFTAEFNKATGKRLKSIDNASAGALSSMLVSEEFMGKTGETAVIYKPDGFKAKKIILAGVGKQKDLCADCFRKAAGTVSRLKSLCSDNKAAFNLGDLENAEYFQGATEGYLLGSYKLLDYKTGDSKKSKNKLSQITFVTENKKNLKRMEKACEKGRIIGEGQNLARTLSNTPANFLTPKDFAKKAQELARKYKFSCRVLDEKAIEKEKMGLYLSVAEGSKQPPRFIILEYKGAPSNRKPIVLVGKGVTFDSGGISLKPGLNMHEMKADMTGAGVVLSAITTAARLGIQQNIVGLLPTTENMPSGKATKPGDVITSRKGLTVEIINTDAEGRLVLADALDYANKFKPQAVIDIATLTGASLYILGYAGAPIMGNKPKLMQMIKDAAENSAERVWEMPIWDDHRNQMKSSIADLVNSGGRPAGTICAGAFLEYFIGDYPWAHIDIAYVDIEPRGSAYIPKGITGIGMRLLVDVLMNWKKL